MRTDSAREVKHFRFVALCARRRASAMVTRAYASKLTRNARCVNRFAAKPVDSSRAVANTRARWHMDASCVSRTLRRRDHKRKLLRTPRRHAFARDLYVFAAQRASSSISNSRRRHAQRDALGDALATHRCARAQDTMRRKRSRCDGVCANCASFRRDRGRMHARGARAPHAPLERDEARDSVPGFTM